jgi:hypothetical protein
MTQYLDSLTIGLQQWAKEYWKEGRVIIRHVPGTQVAAYFDGYDNHSTYWRKPSKRKFILRSNSWEKLLQGLMLAEDPKAYLEENRPHGQPKARVEISVASKEYKIDQEV